MKVVEFPSLNPVLFVPVSPAQNPLFHTKQFNTYWAQEVMLEWERYNKFRNPNDTQYFNLIESNDIVSFQMNFSDSPEWSSYGCSAMSCTGQQFGIGAGTRQTRTGNVFDNHGTITPTQLTTVQWKFRMSDVISNRTGKFYFLIVINWADGTTSQYISEPNQVQATHPLTVLINAYSDTNKDNIFFDMNPAFGLRIDAWFRYKAPAFDRTLFRDQDNDLRQLYAKTYPKFEFVAGGRNGLAPYHVDKISAMLCCDHVIYDGKEMVMDDGEELEISEFAYYPLRTAKTTLVEYYPNESGTFVTGGAVILYEVSAVNGKYPYSIPSLGLIQTTGSPALMVVPAFPVEILNQTQENAFIAGLNTNKASYGLAGTFSIISGNLVYTNAANELFVPYRVRVYKNALKVGLNAVSGRLSFDATMNGSAGMEVLVSCYTSANASYRALTYYTGTSINVNFALAAGDYYVYVYTDDLMTKYFMNTIRAWITELSGDLSTSLDTFSARYSLNINYNLNYLSRCMPTLQTLVCRNFSVTTATFLGFASTMVAITSLDFRNGNLNATQLDDFYNRFWNQVASPNSQIGTITTNGQVGGGVPSATSLSSRNSLIAKGWTISI